MKTVAVDFDGVIHPYTRGWQGETPDDEPPVAGAGTALEMLAAHYQVVVFSTRAETEVGRQAIREWLAHWQLDGFVTDVVADKPKAIAYIDDRAVVFTGDWERALEGVALLDLRGPWTEARRRRTEP